MNRPRPNPFADRAGSVRKNGRVRRRVPPVADKPVAVEPARLTERSARCPHSGVLAVPALQDGTPSDHDRDIMGAALMAAERSGGALVALLLTEDAATDWATLGADFVVRAPRPDPYMPAWDLAVLQRVRETLRPRHVFAPDLCPGPGEILRSLAARTGQTLQSDVFGFDSGQALCRFDGGRLQRREPLAEIVLCAPECALPPHNVRGAATSLALPLSDRAQDTGFLDARDLAVERRTQPLDQSDFIVAAGNGITNWEQFHGLCAAVNATPGGSRVVCDAGKLPRDRQIGASGTLVDPVCYLALGIAGAPQHLQGIERCKHVIAVNTDLHADMIRRADLAIVADAHPVMAALLNRLGHAAARDG